MIVLRGPMRWRKLCIGGPKLFLVLLLLTTALPLFARDRGQFANSTPEMKAWFDVIRPSITTTPSAFFLAGGRHGSFDDIAPG